MIRVALAALLLCVALGRANAGVSTSVLDQVAATPQPDAQLPLDAPFVDEHGTPRTLRGILQERPALLIFADYTCRTLCGPILAFAAAGLDKSGLRPGDDFHLVVVGIDPKDSLSAAAAFKNSRLGRGTPLAAATVMLTGKAEAIAAETNAAGYRYSYDSQHDQYAHPAAAYVITPQGRITRVLSGIGLAGDDLRLALVDAGQGKVGGIADQIHLLCYGFDPTRGVYTASIGRITNIACAITVLAIVCGVGGLLLKRRRETP